MIRRPLCADPSLLGEKKKMEEAAAEAKEADSHSGGREQRCLARRVQV